MKEILGTMSDPFRALGKSLTSLSLSLSPGSCACSREERRWMEKQNKAARQRRKKEEMARIRTLVGTTSSVAVVCPRVQVSVKW